MTVFLSSLDIEKVETRIHQALLTDSVRESFVIAHIPRKDIVFNEAKQPLFAKTRSLAKEIEAIVKRLVPYVRCYYRDRNFDPELLEMWVAWNKRSFESWHTDNAKTELPVMIDNDTIQYKGSFWKRQ